MYKKSEIMRPVPEVIRAGRSLSPDQRLITGTLDHVLNEVRRGRRAGVFTCSEVMEQDGVAWAAVTMRPVRARVWPIALGAGTAAALAVLLAWLLVSAAGALLLVVLIAAGALAGLRQRSAGAVRVGVNVEVDR